MLDHLFLISQHVLPKGRTQRGFRMHPMSLGAGKSADAELDQAAT